MERKEFPYDVAIASVLGGALALTLALTFGLSPFLWPLLGLVIGPLCYKPGEIASTTIACTSDIWKVMREGGFQRFFHPVPFHRWLEGVKKGAFVVVCAMCLMLSSVVLPFLVTLPLVYFGWSSPMMEVDGGIVLFTAVGSALLGVFCWGWLFKVPELRSRWIMPLSRRIFLPLTGDDGFVPLETDGVLWSKVMEKGPLGIRIFFIPLLQLGVLLVPGLVLDVVITIALACASTRRIASMLGATLFCTGAAVAALCGITFAPVLFLIGGIVGWFAGPSLYLLRETLAAAPSTVPVQS